ncbi:hypothetical protein FSW04_10740 [Baekduia soli]|uniref:Uncharacterized protein n=1 Tax=Baekduia soli TaxID=496014 RepID=A0A5B8U578_9ACTN|nr:hypothetical protein [Baekduia soli]QEC47998.1 hypothetical protein FSW04_10740 [Baekduia soli]
MRVRPQRPTDRRSPIPRRPSAHGRVERAPDAPEAADPHLLAERRHRASVAPEDHALYACACGFQFQASVSTSVACPHCGSGQAW